MRIELKTVPNATLDVSDDGTATLTIVYPEAPPTEAVAASARADSLRAAEELVDFVRTDRPDICGVGRDIVLTQRYRTVKPFTLSGWARSDAMPSSLRVVRVPVDAVVDSPAETSPVFALTTTPVDPDPAA